MAYNEDNAFQTHNNTTRISIETISPYTPSSVHPSTPHSLSTTASSLHNMDNPNEANSDNNGSKKRERVSKACTFCRKKKIKCDGMMPCVHCINSNSSDCHYALDVVKKRTRKTKAAMAAAAAAAAAANTTSTELNQNNSRRNNNIGNNRSEILETSTSRGLTTIYEQDYFSASSKDKISKAPNHKRFDDLDSRMNRLESLLVNLTNKMDHSIMRISRSSSGTRRGSFESEDQLSLVTTLINGPPGPLGDEYIKNHDDQIESNSRKNGGKERFSLNPLSLPGKNKRLAGDAPTDTYNGLDMFCGNQSILQIFTDSSIEWLESKVGPSNAQIVLPLKNLGHNFVQTLDEFANNFMGPLTEGNTRYDFGKLSLDRDVALYLVDKLEDVFLVSFIVDQKQIKTLVKYYYDQQSNPNLRKRRLYFSEMMMINAILSVCLGEEIDYRITQERALKPKPGKREPLGLEKLSVKEMVEYQLNFFRNALFYYTRVCVVNQNVLTLQGILVLILHTEMGWAPGINYVMTAVAVRYAHGMGLHRVETLTGLPSERQCLYRRIWYLCQYLDMDICFRDAKPPLINANDVSTLTERDNHSLHIVDHKEVDHNSVLFDAALSFSPLTKDLSDKLKIIQGNHAYCGHLLLALTRIRHDSYVRLHSALAKYTSFDQLVEVIKGLDNQMFELAESCDHRIKPRFYNEPDFQNFTPKNVFGYGHFGDAGLQNLVTLQLTYFLHMMTINRLPFQASFYDQEENADTARIRNLSVYSARTILSLTLNLKDMDVPFLFYSYIIWFPFAACLYLLTVVINRPGGTECMEDIGLAVEASYNLFGTLREKYAGIEHPHTFNEKMLMTDVIIRVVLNIAINVADSNSEMGFLNDERLQQHLRESHTIAPHLYTITQDKTMPKINFKLADGHSSASSCNSPNFGNISPARQTTRNGNSHMLPLNYCPIGTHIRQNDMIRPKDINTVDSPTSSNSTHHRMDSTPFISTIMGNQNTGNLDSFPIPNQDESLDYLNDGTISNLFSGQYYNLPNFFFDNNVGY